MLECKHDSDVGPRNFGFHTPYLNAAGLQCMPGQWDPDKDAAMHDLHW